MMQLNPGAAEFVPSMKTLRLAQTSPVPASVRVGPSGPVGAPQTRSISNNNNNNNTVYGSTHTNDAYYNLPPPDLAPLYLDASEILAHENMLARQLQQEQQDNTIDYSSFDLPFFFHDMMSADMDDFFNYLPYRAEYLLGYAQTSSTNALEVVGTILDWGIARQNSDPKHSERALQLAAEMADMDSRFFHKLLHKLNQDVSMYLQRLCGSNNRSSWRPDDLSGPLCVLLGRVLRALHIGTCVEVPNQVPRFAENACLFITELLKKKSTIDFAIRSLEYCYENLRIISPQLYLDSLHGCLFQRIQFPVGGDTRRRLADLQRTTDIQSTNRQQRFNNGRQRMQPGQTNLTQQTMGNSPRHCNTTNSNVCQKTHAIPVAELNDEENEDFEQFLRESSQSAFIMS